MKAKVSLLALFVSVFLTGFGQQIPNGSFENWTNNWTPVGWNGVESIISILVPIDSSIFTFKDTTTATQGTTSVKLVTDSVTGPASQTIGIQPGAISLGKAYLDINTFMPAFSGIPFIYRPDSIIFDYKASSAGADSGGFQVSLTRKTVPLLMSFPGSAGAAFPLNIDTAWTHVALDLTPYYVSTDYPDTLLIQFISSATNNPVVGTTLNIDAVRFGYVKQPLSVSVSNTIICANDSVTFVANTGGSTNYTYQWNLAGTAISGATGATFAAKDTGSYTVTIDSASVSVTSEPTHVMPDNIVASINGLNDTVCSNASAVTLHGVPAGGVYAGPGVTSSTFSPAAAILGVDSVKYLVNDQNGCAKSAAVGVLVENCTGIDNIEATVLSVYPNPATTSLNISSNQDLAGFNLHIYDVVGQLVISQVLESSSNLVNVVALTNGTYIYRIANKGNEIVTQSKFMVIK